MTHCELITTLCQSITTLVWVDHDTLWVNYDTLPVNHDTLWVDHDTLWVNHDTLWVNHDTLWVNHDTLSGNHDIHWVSHNTVCKSRHCESVTTLVLMSLSLLSCECVTYVELCRGSTLWHSWYVSSVTLTTLTPSRYTLRQYCYCCWRLWLMTTYDTWVRVI